MSIAYWMQNESAKMPMSLAAFETFSGSQAAFGKVVTVIGGYLKA
jgi:hypothetical protein